MTREQLLAMGLSEELVTKVLEAYKTSIDGNYVPKSTFEAEREKVKDLNSTIATRDTQITELGKFKGNAEELQAKVTKLEQDNQTAKEAYDAKLEQLSRETAIKLEIGALVNDIDDVLPKIDATKLVMKDGKIESGLKEQVDSLKESKPHYFKTEGSGSGGNTGKPSGWLFGTTPPNSSGGEGKKDEAAEFGASLAKSIIDTKSNAAKASDYYFK